MFDCALFVAECERIAAEKVRGSRNAREAAVEIARENVPSSAKQYTKDCICVCRSVIRNLGVYKWKDERRVLDWFMIEKVTDKTVIGKSGQRCPIKDVIAWGV